MEKTCDECAWAIECRSDGKPREEKACENFEQAKGPDPDDWRAFCMGCNKIISCCHCGEKIPCPDFEPI